MAEENPNLISVKWFIPTASYRHLSIADSDNLYNMDTCYMDIYLSITGSDYPYNMDT